MFFLTSRVCFLKERIAHLYIFPPKDLVLGFRADYTFPISRRLSRLYSTSDSILQLDDYLSILKEAPIVQFLAAVAQSDKNFQHTTHGCWGPETNREPQILWLTQYKLWVLFRTVGSAFVAGGKNNVYYWWTGTGTPLKTLTHLCEEVK